MYGTKRCRHLSAGPRGQLPPARERCGSTTYTAASGLGETAQIEEASRGVEQALVRVVFPPYSSTAVVP